jgi:hypothetical protein
METRLLAPIESVRAGPSARELNRLYESEEMLRHLFNQMAVSDPLYSPEDQRAELQVWTRDAELGWDWETFRDALRRDMARADEEMR